MWHYNPWARVVIEKCLTTLKGFSLSEKSEKKMGCIGMHWHVSILDRYSVRNDSVQNAQSICEMWKQVDLAKISDLIQADVVTKTLKFKLEVTLAIMLTLFNRSNKSKRDLQLESLGLSLPYICWKLLKTTD